MGKDLKGMNKHAEKDLIALLENPTGAESYMASLGEKRKEKLESELFRLEKLGENIEGCLDESDMVELLEGSDNVEGIMNLAVAAMGKKKSCKLPYLIFKLGLSIEEEEQ